MKFSSPESKQAGTKWENLYIIIQYLYCTNPWGFHSHCNSCE